MTVLLFSRLPFILAAIIGICLLLKREARLSREHDKAQLELPAAPIYSLAMYRHRRDNLHARPLGVRQSRECGGLTDSPDTARPVSPLSPVGPGGGSAA